MVLYLVTYCRLKSTNYRRKLKTRMTGTAWSISVLKSVLWRTYVWGLLWSTLATSKLFKLHFFSCHKLHVAQGMYVTGGNTFKYALYNPPFFEIERTTSPLYQEGRVCRTSGRWRECNRPETENRSNHQNLQRWKGTSLKFNLTTDSFLERDFSVKMPSSICCWKCTKKHPFEKTAECRVKYSIVTLRHKFLSSK